MRGLVIIFMVTITAFSGCRKGDEDPFLSLKSRTNRLCGKWRLVELNETYYIGSNPMLYEKFEFKLKGGQMVVYYNGYSVDQYSNIEYWEFNKNGEYKIETKIRNTKTIIEEGIWSWGAKNKKNDLKKKEYFMLKKLSYNYNNGEEVEEYSGPTLSPSREYVVVKLTDETIKLYSFMEIYEKDVEYQKIKSELTLTKEE